MEQTTEPPNIDSFLEFLSSPERENDSNRSNETEDDSKTVHISLEEFLQTSPPPPPDDLPLNESPQREMNGSPTSLPDSLPPPPPNDNVEDISIEEENSETLLSFDSPSDSIELPEPFQSPFSSNLNTSERVNTPRTDTNPEPERQVEESASSEDEEEEEGEEEEEDEVVEEYISRLNSTSTTSISHDIGDVRESDFEDDFPDNSEDRLFENARANFSKHASILENREKDKYIAHLEDAISKLTRKYERKQQEHERYRNNSIDMSIFDDLKRFNKLQHILHEEYTSSKETNGAGLPPFKKFYNDLQIEGRRLVTTINRSILPTLDKFNAKRASLDRSTNRIRKQLERNERKVERSRRMEEKAKVYASTLRRFRFLGRKINELTEDIEMLEIEGEENYTNLKFLENDPKVFQLKTSSVKMKKKLSLKDLSHILQRLKEEKKNVMEKLKVLRAELSHIDITKKSKNKDKKLTGDISIFPIFNLSQILPKPNKLINRKVDQHEISKNNSSEKLPISPTAKISIVLSSKVDDSTREKLEELNEKNTEYERQIEKMSKIQKTWEEFDSNFICPITQDVMTDPVILEESGHTFEREAISKWISRNHTCPVSRKRLFSKKLIDNIALRGTIDQWKKEQERAVKKELKNKENLDEKEIDRNFQKTLKKSEKKDEWGNFWNDVNNHRSERNRRGHDRSDGNMSNSNSNDLFFDDIFGGMFRDGNGTRRIENERVERRRRGRYGDGDGDDEVDLDFFFGGAQVPNRQNSNSQNFHQRQRRRETNDDEYGLDEIFGASERSRNTGNNNRDREDRIREEVGRLREMGFSGSQLDMAEEVLRRSGGNINTVVDYLISRMGQKENQKD